MNALACRNIYKYTEIGRVCMRIDADKKSCVTIINDQLTWNSVLLLHSYNVGSYKKIIKSFFQIIQKSSVIEF